MASLLRRPLLFRSFWEVLFDGNRVGGPYGDETAALFVYRQRLMRIGNLPGVNDRYRVIEVILPAKNPKG